MTQEAPLETLAKQYGRPEGENIQTQEPAEFRLQRPDKSEARVALGVEPEVPSDIQDIDPGQWLQHDDSFVTDTVVTRAGRLVLAALDEMEQEKCRKLSEKYRQPGRPQAGKELGLKALRLWTVAFSLNKAYKLWGTPQELTADQIEKNKKLAGEITMMVNKISEISGYKEDTVEPTSFFSMG
jgi:hypothetical protein